MELTERRNLRYHQFDKLRTLCAYLIVLIHSDSPFREYYIPITRCAVPIFFMLSGYLMVHKTKEQIRKSIYSILRYVVVSTVVFAVVKIGVSFMKNDWDWISVKSLVDFVLFNDNPIATHLWYLTAYLYILVLVYYLTGVGINYAKLWPIVPVFLVGNICLGNYSCLFFGNDLNCNITRNFLFIGLPYFILGGIVQKQYRLPRNVITIVCSIVLAAITSCIEDRWLDRLTINHIDDHFISTPFLAISLFLLFYNFRNSENFISKIGRKYSLYIYLYHPLVVFAYIMLKTYSILPNDLLAYYVYIHPIVVFGLTTLGIYSVVNSKRVLYDRK